MSEKIKLSIAIPVYNSESTIENLVTQLIEKLSKEYELEIVLINDCSKDNSEKICIGLYERNKDIVKSNPENTDVGKIIANLRSGKAAFAGGEGPTPDKRKTPPIQEQ